MKVGKYKRNGVHYGRVKFGSWGLKELMKVEIEECKSMKL